MAEVAVPDLSDDHLERHNKSSLFKVTPGPHTEAWKWFALKTTNQALNHVPEAHKPNAERIWLRVFQKSHTKLLRPGALKLVEAWQQKSSARQQSALSDLFWSLGGYMTARVGVTESKSQYGPKYGEKAAFSFTDPFGSALGRPSSAPIAHASQRKLEERKRQEAAELELKAKLLREAMGDSPSKGTSKADMWASNVRTPYSGVGGGG